MATIGVGSLTVKDFVVQVDVVHVDGTVESNGDHLGNVGGFEGAGNPGTVGGTKAVRKNALGGVAIRGSVGIIVDS